MSMLWRPIKLLLLGTVVLYLHYLNQALDA